jgi:hypothetical protein
VKTERIVGEHQHGNQHGNVGSLVLHGLLGLLIGVILYIDHSLGLVNPAAKPWLAATSFLWVVAIVGWTLMAGSLWSPAGRIVCAAILGVVAGFAAFHAVRTSNDEHDAFRSFPFLLALATLLHVLTSLASGFDPARKRFDYPFLFEIAWRNALLVPVAAALTGISWVLLWAAAWLMESIGIDALSQVASSALMICLFTSTVFVLSLGMALRRAEALVNLRRFWLALNTWFLPLALFLALAWSIALFFTGTETLFATRRAALLLFWFIALAVLFANAAYQDGEEPPAYPKLLATLCTWTWRCLPLLAALGIWALLLRVWQYGWSPERLWAALVGGLALVYAIGYSLPLRQRWLGGVGPTNIAAALLLSTALLSLLSPIADARKISVRSQMARLQSGRIAPEIFDYGFLVYQAGTYGASALAKLANDPSLPAEARRRAADALEGRHSSPLAASAEDRLARWQEFFPVLPAGAIADAALVQLLTEEVSASQDPPCFRRPSQCTLWIFNADATGPTEAVLLMQPQGGSTLARLYVLEGGRWTQQGVLTDHNLTLLEWRAAIESGAVSTAPTRWPDIIVNDQRIRIR